MESAAGETTAKVVHFIVIQVGLNEIVVGFEGFLFNLFGLTRISFLKFFEEVIIIISNFGVRQFFRMIVDTQNLFHFVQLMFTEAVAINNFYYFRIVWIHHHMSFLLACIISVPKI